jgi:hypothetical protein
MQRAEARSLVTLGRRPPNCTTRGNRLIVLLGCLVGEMAADAAPNHVICI